MIRVSDVDYLTGDTCSMCRKPKGELSQITFGRSYTLRAVTVIACLRCLAELAARSAKQAERIISDV